MVIAEAVKFNTGEVILLLLVVAASVLVAAALIAVIGVSIGIALARWSLPSEAVQQLPRGSRVGLVIGALACPIVSWIMLWGFASWLWDESGGSLVLALAPFPLPIVWGWWNGRRCRFGGDDVRPSPPLAPPPNSDP